MSALVIGIAGGSGSGKTSITKKILEMLDPDHVVVLQHDSYYKDLGAHEHLAPMNVNFDHPDSLETALLIEHVRSLKNRIRAEQPLYNFVTHRRMKETKRLSPKDIIIVEGILIFVEKELRDLMDIKIYIDADADERLIRRIRRDIVERSRSVDSIIQQYTSTVKPMHLEFVEPSKHWADIIVPRGVENSVAIDMVVTKIRSLIQEKRLPVSAPH